jgi:hypothetical protein
MQNNRKKKSHKIFLLPVRGETEKTRRSATQCTKHNPSAKHRNTQHKKTANAPAEEEEEEEKEANPDPNRDAYPSPGILSRGLPV